MLLRSFEKFFASDSAGGILLILSAVLAMFAANSMFAPLYEGGLNAVLSITINEDGLSKPLILWSGGHWRHGSACVVFCMDELE